MEDLGLRGISFTPRMSGLPASPLTLCDPGSLRAL